MIRQRAVFGSTLALLLPVILGGCSDSTGVNCMAVVPTAITVVLDHALTGARLETDDASGYVQSASSTYLLQQAQDTSVLYATFNKPGTYTVVVEKPGFFSWRQDGVKIVKENACFVKTRDLTARLVPRGN